MNEMTGRGVETACGGGGRLALPRQPARQKPLTLTGLAGEEDGEFLSTPTRAVLAPRQQPTLTESERASRGVTAVLPWADVGGRPLIRQPPTLNYLTLTGLTGEEDGDSCFCHGTCLLRRWRGRPCGPFTLAT